MAKSRLESALKAGQDIDQGIDYPKVFTKVCVDYNIQLEREADGVYSLQYSCDGKLLAIGCGNGTIKLYETKTGRKLPDVRKSRYGGYQVMALRFHPKKQNLIYAATSEGQVLVCDISDFVHDGIVDLSHIDSDKDERWKEVIVEKKDGEKNHINCLDFDYTFTRFATSGKDRSVRLYDASTNALIHEFQTKYAKEQTGNSGRVFALRFHPKYDDVFVTAGWDDTVRIWNTSCEGDSVRTIPGSHVCGDALDLNEFKVLTGSWRANDALQIWNYSGDYGVSSKEKPQVVDFPAGKDGPFLYAAQFCDNNVIVAGGSGTNSALAINYETNQVIGDVKFPSPVHAIDTIMGGRMFAVGDRSGNVKMCSLK